MSSVRIPVQIRTERHESLFIILRKEDLLCSIEYHILLFIRSLHRALAYRLNICKILLRFIACLIDGFDRSKRIFRISGKRHLFNNRLIIAQSIVELGLVSGQRSHFNICLRYERAVLHDFSDPVEASERIVIIFQNDICPAKFEQSLGIEL